MIRTFQGFKGTEVLGSRFSANNNTEQKEQHIRDTKAYIQEHVPIPDSCEIIKETLSYYSEGGNVSILVVCRGT